MKNKILIILMALFIVGCKQSNDTDANEYGEIIKSHEQHRAVNQAQTAKTTEAKKETYFKIAKTHLVKLRFNKAIDAYFKISMEEHAPEALPLMWDAITLMIFSKEYEDETIADCYYKYSQLLMHYHEDDPKQRRKVQILFEKNKYLKNFKDNEEYKKLYDSISYEGEKPASTEK